MNIMDFTGNHIEEAQALAKSNYEEERQFVPVLPPVVTLPDLVSFANNGLGVVMLESGRMSGFLCCYSPWDNAFGTTKVRGTFSPIHAHGAVYENRELIYKRLYQAAAEKWVGNGILSHAISLYAHDACAINSLFVSGFGLRTIDAIRPMEEIKCERMPKLHMYELKPEEKTDILELNNLLISHLSYSPMFMRYNLFNSESLKEHLDKEKSRYFAAFQEGKMVAYIKIMDGGENFASYDSSIMNIQGACCLPECRGSGVYQNLLNYLIATLASEGYTRLGVDFESFNPTAYGFWLKYFTAYINGVVRRIDEQILEAGE